MKSLFKSALLAATALSGILLSTPSQSQGVRAVDCPGNSYFYNLGFTDNITNSPEGVFSFFWNSDQAIPTNGRASIMEAWSPIYQGFLIFRVTFENYVNRPPLQDGIHLRIFVSDGTGGTSHYAYWTSNELVRNDNLYHMIALRFNTNNYDPTNQTWYANAYHIDGNAVPDIMTWAPAPWSGSDGSAQSFSVPFENAPWYGCADVNLVGFPTDFYNGFLSQVYGHFEIGDNAAIEQLHTRSGFARITTYAPPGLPPVTYFFPENLGPKCRNPLYGTTLTDAALCLRDGMPQFLYNQGGATSFLEPQGYPSITTAIIDPWGSMP